MPRFIIDAGLKLPIFLAQKYYSSKYKPFIIRKNTSDRNVFKQIFVLRDCKLPVKINPKLIIDAGAYVGYSSIYFASKYPQAKIISIEPDKANFKILEKNTKNFKNISLVNAGIWPSNENLKLVSSRDGFWATKTKKAKSGENYDIKGTTINQILKNFNYDKIDILKIDIEGAEKELFSKNYNSWLNKINIIIIELHDRFKEGCSEALYSAIKKYNFHKIQQGEKVILIKK
ncbi:FkbM family methyltransferase [Candidatus Babeliales bacterium]|nr:FkbM family methyltransferase [Candidatus Babeliales bacterium]